MTSSSKKTAGALAGAVTLAFGAYTIGSQADDGSALADTASTAAAPTTANSRPSFVGRSRGAGTFDDLATKLGVEKSALRRALVDVRQELPRKSGRTDRADDLAKELGLSSEKVQSALETLRPTRDERREDRRNGLADALAKELGVDATNVRSALDAARPERGMRRGRRSDGLAEVAGALGVKTTELRAALEKIRPGVRDDRRADHVEALAKALGVETAKAQAAVDKLRADHDVTRDARRKAVAAVLAEKLSLDVAKVEEALESTSFGFRGHHGFGGRRGEHRHP